MDKDAQRIDAVRAARERAVSAVAALAEWDIERATGDRAALDSYVRDVQRVFDARQGIRDAMNV